MVVQPQLLAQVALCLDVVGIDPVDHQFADLAVDRKVDEIIISWSGINQDNARRYQSEEREQEKPSHGENWQIGKTHRAELSEDHAW